MMNYGPVAKRRQSYRFMGEKYSGGDMMGLAVESQMTERFASLQKNGNVPIEDLLTVYNYPVCQMDYFAQNRLVSSSYTCCYVSLSDSKLSSGYLSTDNTNETTYSSSEEEILSNQDLTLDKDEIARDLLLSRSEGHDRETSVSDLITVLDMRPTAQPDVGCSFTSRSHNMPSSSSPSAAAVAAATNSCSSVVEVDECSSDSSSSDSCIAEHDDGTPKSIPVGPEHQADLPDLVTFQQNALGNETQEHTLWDPSKLSEYAVEAYLTQVMGHHQHPPCFRDYEHVRTGGNPVKDNEEALYLLLQCGYDVEEALRRHYMQILPPADPFSLWSPEECANFASGLRLYGKDFYLIQQNKIKTRSVSELVQFYYLWKRTDQYTAFCNKSISESKRRVPQPPVSCAITTAVPQCSDNALSLPGNGSNCPANGVDIIPAYSVSVSPSWTQPSPDGSMGASFSQPHFSGIYSHEVGLVDPSSSSSYNAVHQYVTDSTQMYANSFVVPSGCYCSPYENTGASSSCVQGYFGMEDIELGGSVPHKKFSSPANVPPAAFSAGLVSSSFACMPTLHLENSLPSYSTENHNVDSLDHLSQIN